MNTFSQFQTTLTEIRHATESQSRAAEKFEDYTENLGVHDAIEYMQEEIVEEKTYNAEVGRLHDFASYLLDAATEEKFASAQESLRANVQNRYQDIMARLMNGDLSRGEQSGLRESLYVVDRVLKMIDADVPHLR